MKKRVRVYKAGGQTNQLSQQQIEAYLTQQMSADDYDGDTDALKDDLAGAGIDEDVADEYITSVSNDLGLNQDIVSIEEQQRLADEQAQLAVDEEQALLEQQEAADEARQQQQAAMYNVEINPEDTEDTPEDEESYMRQGGTNLSKRSFIKQYTKFTKMAQGGDTPSVGSDDIPGDKGRERQGLNFLNAVRNTANDAILKQEAEAQYNSIYGNPQVGAFQDGGIQQEQIDFENPMHHIQNYAAGVGDIFRNNQNIQNDAPQGQLGGFTDADSGLYKFIGGGDNESADEQYQDADIDFNQQQFARGGVPRRLSNRDLTARGYYSESGQKIAAPNTQGKAVTSVEYLNKNIFGMPRQVKYNYGPGSPQPTAPAVNTPAPGEYRGPDEFTGRRQPVADWMMRSGIPGIKQWGANMTKSGMIPEIEAGTEKVIPPTTTAAPASNEPYYPPMDARAQRRESRDDAKLNRFLGNTKGVDTINDERMQKKMPEYNSFNPNQTDVAKSIQDLQSQSRTIRKLGGPIDYTEYAYGGDIAIPELHRAQIGLETNAFDPNANPLGTTKDYKGDTVDFTGKVVKKRNTNFSFGEDATKLKNPFVMDENYVNPLTGEKSGVIMNEEGAYTDDGLVDEATKKEDGSYSQLFDVNRRDGKGKLISNIGQGIGIGINVGLDALDKINARKQENQLLADVTSAESNYGISTADNRGYWDPNSGDIDPSRTGQMRSKYGGGIYAMGGNTMDEDKNIRYMTQAEIDEFRANGGELEFV